MLAGRLVHIVDADALSTAHGAGVLRSFGYDVRTHVSGAEFMFSQPDPHPGCVLLDIQMPEPDGLAIQEKLIARGSIMPVILFTGDHHIELAIRAMRAGALHFLEKPYADEDLLAEVADAFERLGISEARMDRKIAAEARLARLSPRERQVLEGLMTGLPNKLIAHGLAVSIRTVEMHRMHAMEKLRVRSLVAALRLYVHANGEAPEDRLVELPSTPGSVVAP